MSHKLYYTDGEIYINLKQGVKPHVLAELNACSVKEILLARDRYLARLQRTDDEYNILKDELLRRNDQMAENMRRKKFTYSPEITEKIKYYLSKDVSRKEIYNKLFENKKDCPLYSTFLVKCRNLLTEMDIIYIGNSTIADIEEESNKENVVVQKLTEGQQEKEVRSLREQLEDKRRKYYEEVGDTAEKMRELMYEIAKLDIAIEQLSKN